MEGHSGENRNDMTSTSIRQQVLERDKHTCQRCSRTDMLEVHHKIKSGDGGLDELDNLITYCIPCHKTIEPYQSIITQDRARTLFPAKNNLEKQTVVFRIKPTKKSNGRIYLEVPEALRFLVRQLSGSCRVTIEGYKE